MSGNKMPYCRECGKRHGQSFHCVWIPMIHWLGVTSGVCSRHDEAEDVTVETYETPSGQGTITNSAAAGFIENVTCPFCRSDYAYKEFRRKMDRQNTRSEPSTEAMRNALEAFMNLPHLFDDVCDRGAECKVCAAVELGRAVASNARSCKRP